jgi:hypothetical protein
MAPVGLLQRPLVELEPMRASMEGMRRRRRIQDDERGRRTRPTGEELGAAAAGGEKPRGLHSERLRGSKCASLCKPAQPETLIRPVSGNAGWEPSFA